MLSTSLDITKTTDISPTRNSRRFLPELMIEYFANATPTPTPTPTPTARRSRRPHATPGDGNSDGSDSDGGDGDGNIQAVSNDGAAGSQPQAQTALPG